MQRPLEHGRVGYSLDRSRHIAGTASASEKNEREVGPRRLARDGLAQSSTVKPDERIVRKNGTGGQPVVQRLEQQLSILVRYSFNSGARQELPNDLRVTARGCDDKEPFHGGSKPSRRCS